jgi:hypothetical protein
VDRASLVLSQHPKFLDIITRSRAEFAAGRTMTLEQMKRAVSAGRTSTKGSRRKSRRNSS